MFTKKYRSSAGWFSPADNGEAFQGASGSASEETTSREDAGEAGYEKEASEMGWVPQDQFQGDPEKWIDAKEFVDRGTHILPILQANNRRLRADLLTRDQELVKVRQSLEATEKTVKTLQQHYEESVKQEIQKARSELKEQLIAAKEVGDYKTEIDIQEKLDSLKEEKKEVLEVVKQPELSPEFISWKSENSWFGERGMENTIKTLEVLKIGEDLRKGGDTTVGRPFMDKCMQIYASHHKERTNSKVEGGSNGQGTGTTRGRKFPGLPAEAKAACHADTRKFVGPGKMFKTEQEWEDHWTNLYLAQG